MRACAARENFCSSAMEIWDGDHKANFLRSGIAPFFQHCQDTVTLIFHRCCRSSAAVTPVKYERYFTNLAGTFKRSKKHLTEKLPNGVLVTPTPERNMTSVRTGEKLIPYFKKRIHSMQPSDSMSHRRSQPKWDLKFISCHNFYIRIVRNTFCYTFMFEINYHE